MRHEVRRFVYMCDGLQHGRLRCESMQVIDAVDEKEADHLVRMYGWTIDRKGVICKEKKHLKYNRTCDLPPTNPNEWMEGRTA